MASKRVCPSSNFRFSFALIATRLVASFHVDDPPNPRFSTRQDPLELTQLTIDFCGRPSSKYDTRKGANILGKLVFGH